MTVLIADDNALIRSWLKIMLQQAEQMLTVLEACDGEEALQLCLEQPVDLLITDIKMPGMDGVTLIRELTARRPSIRSAVLSSYDDFSYVRIALKCGALDYILKAEMKQEDIEGLLAKAKESISASASTQARHQASIKDARAAYERFRSLGDGETASLLGAFGIDENAESCSILMLRVQAETQVDSNLRTADVLCSTLKMEGTPGLAIPVEAGAFLLLSKGPEVYSEEAKQLHLRLLTSIGQNLSAAGLGRIGENCEVLWTRGESFSGRLRHALDLIRFQVYYKVTALPSEDAPNYRNAEKAFLESIQNLVHLEDRSRACFCLQKYAAERHEARELPHRIRRVVIASVQVMTGALPSHAQSHQALERCSQELSDAATAEQMTRLLSRFCVLYMEAGGSREKAISPAIARAVSYCNENYGKKVTLEELADLTKLNRSYFSQLFHKEMGKSFGDYLESVRIQKACRLLKTSGASMSEIAEQVGFSNQNYFTKVFKKAIGVTPSQYRQGAARK